MDDLDVLRSRDGFWPTEPLFPNQQQQKPSAPTMALSFSHTCPKCGYNHLQPGIYDSDRDKMLRSCPLCLAEWEEEPLDKKLNPKPKDTNAGLGGERVWNQLVSSIRQALAWWRGQKKSKQESKKS